MEFRICCIYLMVCTFVQVVCTIDRLHDSLGGVIYVDKHNGINDSSCWTGGVSKPCSSLGLALEGVKNISEHRIPPVFPQWIFLEPGDYILDKNAISSFSGPLIREFGLIANESDTDSPAVSIVCAHRDSGFKFLNVSKITFRNIWIKGCASVQYSTSRKSETDFWKFRVGLYFVMCSDITFERVWISEMGGIGMLVYSSYGSNVFQSCRFFDNSVAFHDSDTYPAGGGLYIEFSSCIPLNSSTCTTLKSAEYVPSVYLIDDTEFYTNSASVSESVMNNDDWLLPAQSNYSSIGRGGGLSIVFKGYSRNIVISVNNCSLTNNVALWGGGLFVEFQDNSTSNSLMASNVIFSGNEVLSDVFHSNGTGGGGVRIGFIFYEPSHVFNNSVLFSNCDFLMNKAYWGGGVSFYTAREQKVVHPSNSLGFYKCNWSNNSAWVGAAVDLTVFQASHQGLPVVVDFSDITVLSHGFDSNLKANGTLFGIGAMYVDSIPIQFNGFNYFSHNYHTALATLGTTIKVKKNTTLTFLDNRGQYGGAMNLLGNSFLEAGHNSFFNFTENTAQVKGGAIYTQTLSKHDLITAPNCFVRYEDIHIDPEFWNVSFHFLGNTASDEDNAIYTTTIIPCNRRDVLTRSSQSHIFCMENWVYMSTSGSLSNCTEQIQTDPEKFNTGTDSPTNNRTTVSYTGEEVHLSKAYDMSDDFNNNATSRVVFTAHLPVASGNMSKDVKVPLYISGSTLLVNGAPGDYLIDLYTIHPRVVYTTVSFTLLECPFGYNSTTTKCVCPNDQALFEGIVKCSGDSYISRLALQGQWAGVDNGTRVAGFCPFTKRLDKSQLHFPNPESNEDPGDYFCAFVNRSGRLCGKCKDKFGPALNSHSYDCISCPPGIVYYSWALYILTEIFPLTLFFLILIIFSVSLTSESAYAFVFFSQIISATFTIYDFKVAPYYSLSKVYMGLYGIWNLDILDVVHEFQFCLDPKMQTIELIALEYVVGFFPLLLIFTMYALIDVYNRGVRPVRWLCRPVHHCLSRLKNSWNPKNSLIDAIAAFLLLSYIKLILTSVKLLRYTSLYDKEGQLTGIYVYYDGTMKAFTNGHILYVCIAVLVLVLVTLHTLLLLLFPFKFFHTCTNYIFCGCCQLSGGRLEQFLNAFYGCFKDGTQDGTYSCRVFAGLYFVSRAFFAILHFISQLRVRYLVQNIFCVLAILSFASVRPYRKDFYNVLDSCMFALLLSISILNEYNVDTYIDEGQDISPVVIIIEYILIYIPVLLMSLKLMQWFFEKYVKKFFNFSLLQRSRLGLITSESRSNASCVEDDNIIITLIDERPQMYKRSDRLKKNSTLSGHNGTAQTNSSRNSNTNSSSSG